VAGQLALFGSDPARRILQDHGRHARALTTPLGALLDVDGDGAGLLHGALDCDRCSGLGDIVRDLSG
jgi:hypothetical protein